MAIARHERYGRGVTHMRVDADYLVRGAELTEQLLTHFDRPSYEPPHLPRVGMELIELTRKSDVSVADVVTLCEQDALVAARVVQVASSAAFRTAAPVRSLHDAAMRLGLRRLADVFLEVSFKMRVFRAPGFSGWMDELARHSMATARIARVVCRYTGFPDEYAFLGGLLHDVGVAASLITLAERRRNKKTAPDLGLLLIAIDEAHQPAAERLAAAWELPQDLAMVLGHHHDATIGGHVHPLAAAIALADVVADSHGLGGGFVHDDMQRMRAVAALDLSSHQLELIERDAALAVIGI